MSTLFNFPFHNSFNFFLLIFHFNLPHYNTPSHPFDNLTY